MIVASIGHLQMDIWSHLELNYKTGLLHLRQIEGFMQVYEGFIHDRDP